MSKKRGRNRSEGSRNIDSKVEKKVKKMPSCPSCGWSSSLTTDFADLMEIWEVARLLGKTPKTIKNIVARREIPFVRVGNKNMILRSSFEEWLKRKEFKPWQ